MYERKAHISSAGTGQFARLPQPEAICGINMGKKHAYTTKADLERLVLRMHKTGILYFEATREFKKQFILAALRTAHGDQSRAAQPLGMHRNTLVRNIRCLNIDIRALGSAERIPAQRAASPSEKKIVS